MVSEMMIGLVYMVIISVPVFAQEQTEQERFFEMSLSELMNVEITTAGKKAERRSEIPASTVVITREDIRIAGYSNLSEIMENIPGIFIINDYYMTSGYPGVRGFYPGGDDRNIMILVNGVSQVYDITGTFPLSKVSLPVEAIDRIEVVRGPMSVIYGSGAFYGVVNIFTNEATTSEVSASIGSQKTGKLYGRFAGSNGDFRYVVNSTFSYTRGIDQPINAMMSNPSALAAVGIPSDYTTGGKLEDVRRFFGLSLNCKSLTFDFSYNDSNGEGYYLYPSPFNGTPARYTSGNALIKYRKQFSEHVTLEGKFDYSVNRMWAKYEYLFEDFYGIQQHETNAWEGEVDVFAALSQNLNLTAGVHCRSILNAYNMYDLPSFGPTLEHQYTYLAPDDNMVTRAVFTQFDYQPIENLKFVAGARLEQTPEYTIGLLVPDSAGMHFGSTMGSITQDNIVLIPRLAAIWSMNERNTVKILYGKAINRPSFFQNRNNSLDPMLPELEPEWIDTYELNYITTPLEEIILSVALYYNTLDRLISRTSELQNGTYTSWFANGGKMATTGVEVTVQSEPIKNLRADLSVTVQKTEDLRREFKDIQVAYSPTVLGYGNFSYCFFPGATFALTGTYVGEMLPFFDETIPNADGSHGARIGQPVSGYLQLGANLRLANLIQEGCYLNVRCSNLTDRDIYYPTTTNNSWADKGYLGAGRTILLSMGYEF